MKKILITLIAVFMVILSACSGSENENNEANGASDTGKLDQLIESGKVRIGFANEVHMHMKKTVKSKGQT